ncbi:MAG TPA: hypothetical protein VMA31_08675 [Bryobacteraceae bacterium]|nr:hypothetical protein [Bryobacteraceae bacterium]
MTPAPQELITSLVGPEVTRPVHQNRIVFARVSFWVAIALVGIGAGILIWGVADHGDLKSSRTVVGALMNVLGAFVLKIYDNVENRLSHTLETAEFEWLIGRITDPVKRDQAIFDRMRSLQEKKGWFKRLLGR